MTQRVFGLGRVQQGNSSIKYPICANFTLNKKSPNQSGGKNGKL